jgi:hypothetical protein
MRHEAARDHGDIISDGIDHRLTQAEGLRVDCSAARAERRMVEDDHWVVTADSRPHEPECLMRGGREDNPQPAGLEEEGTWELRVLRRVRACGAGRAHDDERQPHLAPGHVAQPAGLVHELIEGDIREAREHDVDHRAKPSHRRADRRAHERGLRDGTVDDPLWPEFVRKAPRGPHDADPDVFAPNEDARVLSHAHGDSVGERRSQTARCGRRSDRAHANTSSKAR